MTEPEIAQLITPISEAEPCGPSLVEDAANLEISQQFDLLVGEKPPPMVGEVEETSQAKQNAEWRKLSKDAINYLLRSKDLKIAGFLTVAELRLNGLGGFSQGLHLCEQLVQLYWDRVHPTGADFEETLEDRKMALEVFNDPQTVKILGSVPLISGPGFRYSLSQVSDIQSTGGEQELVGLRSALQKLDEEGSELLRKNAVEVDRLLKALELTVNPHLVDGDEVKVEPLKFKEVKAQIAGILKALRALGIIEPAEPGTEDEGAPAVADDEPVEEAPRAGVHSRKDVIDRLGEICRYYEKQEPGSPVPFLLRRTMRIVKMDFHEICEEFTLQSGTNLEMIFGKSEIKKN